jgi:hypothetical protein
MSKNKLPFLFISKAIKAYLEKKSNIIISEVGIEQAEKTMKTLWKIKEKEFR